MSEHEYFIEDRDAGKANPLVMRWIKCSCGWCHMIHKRHWASSDADRVLHRMWYFHAYNETERAILRELGDELPC